MKKYLIIPAAGEAKRLRPLSNSMSKSMVPINGRPLLQYIFDAYLKYFDECIVVTNSTLNDIEEYISRKKYSNITTVKQENALGPLHAIDLGLNAIECSEFSVSVVLGDTFIRVDDLTQFVDTDALAVAKVNDYSRWCLINSSTKELLDKPSKKPENFETEYLALIGIYSFRNGNKVRAITTSIIESGITGVDNEFQISQLLEKYKINRLVELPISSWYDFGTLKDYYENSARLLNSLSFTRPDSSLEFNFENGTVSKVGERCANEIIWYNEFLSNPILEEIKPFLPNIISVDISKNTYKMEYITGTPISDMIVYDNLSNDSIEFIINKVLSISKLFFEVTHKKYIYKPINSLGVCELDVQMYVNRVEQTCAKEGIDMPGIREFAESTIEYSIWSYIHGDFHLGNMLFDQGTGKIKLIDPRGKYGDYYCIGDYLYDLTKLYQSIYGEYIWIYVNEEVNQNTKQFILSLLDKFVEETIGEEYKEVIRKRVPILLINALPFHYDNKVRYNKIKEKAIELLNEHI